MDQFIDIPGVDKKLRLAVRIVVANRTFKQVLVIGKNGSLEFTRQGGTWEQTGGKEPKTSTARTHIDNIKRALDDLIK